MASGIEIRPAHFPGRAPIEAYGNGGFRFAGMSHRGSLLCLPSGIHGWEASAADELDAARFARVLEEAQDVEVLLVGTGAVVRALAPGVKARLRDAGIVSDSMNTGAAVRTYNVMVAESRAVAAALIAV